MIRQILMERRRKSHLGKIGGDSLAPLLEKKKEEGL